MKRFCELNARPDRGAAWAMLTNRDRNEHTDAHNVADADGDADRDRNCNQHGNAYRIADADRDLNQYGAPHSDVDGNGDPYSDSDQHGGIWRGHTHSDGIARGWRVADSYVHSRHTGAHTNSHFGGDQRGAARAEGGGLGRRWESQRRGRVD